MLEMALLNITERIIKPSLPALPSLRKCADNAYRSVRTYRREQDVKCNAFLPTRRQPTIRYRKGNNRPVLQCSIPWDSLCVVPKPFPQIGGRVSRNSEFPMMRYPEYFTKVQKQPTRNRRPHSNETENATDIQKTISCGYFTNSRIMYPIYLANPKKPISRHTYQSKRAYIFDKVTGRQRSLAINYSRGPEAYPMYFTGSLGKVSSPSFHETRRSYAQEPDKTTIGQVSGTSFGKRVGKLDAANEQGHFHRVNQSKLQKFKQSLEGKEKLKDKEETKDSKDDKA